MISAEPISVIASARLNGTSKNFKSMLARFAIPLAILTQIQHPSA
jgi:hypothetical protein